MDYSKTVSLPQTSFPMRGNLSEKEPEIMRLWDEKEVYKKIQEKNKGNASYILHDGPPYANGQIHLGTALNKILKDVVVKYRSLRGFYSPYKPGWDCHGMPIEHQVFTNEKKHKNEVDVSIFRKKTAAYAKKFVEIQKKEFRRLGVLGDWEHPYLTLSPDYEAAIIRAFGNLAFDGYIYQGYKPIYWCISCETALAEAEIEYNDKKSQGIYVKFPVVGEEKTCLLIWTTTPWTLPSNTGIAVHPDYNYLLLDNGGEKYIIAEQRKEAVIEKMELTPAVIKKMKGRELEGVRYLNPLADRESRVILAEFVSSDEGTGCVHIAPGHGEDDYYAGLKNNLEVLSPVDEKGYFTEDVKSFAGMKVFDADSRIIETLKATGALLYQEDMVHSYPHCWRCKKPVIFKSTTQWFLKIDHNNLRGVMAEEIEKVRWAPPEGKNRISSMVQLRPDWCLSRQRLWGVPIPVFYCSGCGKAIITKETISHIEELVKQSGSDIWVEKDEKELLPKGFTCPFCNASEFKKEKDILDVWFDSGVSHLAVLKEENALSWPADLYLEGSDQHRGWFQTSLITSCGITNRAPYKAVLTHGFVVDAEGRKMSKSMGNVVTPQEIIKRHGAEILRIWAVSENYQQDIRISETIIKNSVMSYRTIRNTFRYLLGNLHDFNPNDAVPESDMKEVDRWAEEKMKSVSLQVAEYYESFAFNKAYEEIYRFCNVSLSSFYLDHLKDRLYTYGKHSLERRSAQTALYFILAELLRITAPVLSFTAEEVYQHQIWDKKESVFLENWQDTKAPDATLLAKWERFFEIRRQVLKKIEDKREEKIVGSGLEAKVTISAKQETLEFLKGFEGLPELFIVSEVILASGDSLEVTVEKTSFGKCQRCWICFPEIGSSDAPEICFNCQRVLKEDGIHN